MASSFQQYFTDDKSRSLGLTYFSMAILFGTWVSRIPEIQNQLALSESRLGLAMLSMSVGAFIVTPFAGYLFTKTSLSSAMRKAVIAMSISMIFIVLAPSYFSLVIVLFLFGLSEGYLNIAINTAASALEKEIGRTIMSTCHGMFSLGAMIGVGLGSLLVGMNVESWIHYTGMSIAILMLLWINYKHLKTLPDAHVENEKISWPPQALWAITFIGLMGMTAEGVIADWSGIFLEKTIHASPFLWGMGFAGFSGSMAIGRFFGDELIPKIGAARMLWMSCLLGAAGILLAAFSTGSLLCILGFSIAGFGLSVLVPIIFSAAGKIPGIPASQGIATVAGIGILGFLGGPPLIGFIAEALSLKTGFILTGAMTFVAFMMAISRARN